MSITSVVDDKLWKTVSTGNMPSSTYDGALGFNMIRIKPNMDAWAWQKDEETKELVNKVIAGVMISEFQYSLDSSWETQTVPFDSGLGNVIGGLSTLGGGGELGYVYKSKKYWKRSGYIEISPEIRFIDVDGDGLPLRIAELLLLWATASDTGGIGKLAKKVSEGTVALAKKGMNAVSSAITDPPAEMVADKDSNFAQANAGVSETGQVLGNAVTNYITDIDDLVTLRKSPPPLIVEIGRIYKHTDMVLEKVTFKFSREVTENGPLYIDATLTLSTRKMVSTRKDTGLLSTAHGRPTVNIVAGEAVVESNAT